MIEVYHEMVMPNCFKVRFGWLKLYFSYHTLVGLSAGWRAVMLDRGRSNTTSKHINKFLSEMGGVDVNVGCLRVSEHALLAIAEFLQAKVMQPMTEERMDEIHALMGFEDAANRT